MYHPYTTHSAHAYRPFTAYTPPNSGDNVCHAPRRQTRFSREVCRDNAFRRDHDHQNTTGYRAYDPDQSSELADWKPIVTAGLTPCGCTPIRERFSPGTTLRTTGTGEAELVRLWKEDFQVLRNGNLLIQHPRFTNRTAFVVFLINDCPDCQDTKTMWEAYAIEAHYLTGGGDSAAAGLGRLCTKSVEALMFKRRDGRVVDYNGPFNARRLKQLLKKHCLRAFK